MSRAHTIANVSGEIDGDEALTHNVSAAAALADVVRTTLGPVSRDKMVVSNGEVLVTNDGSHIVDRLDVEAPAARIVADLARAQGVDLGDGATSAIVLAGALLREAEPLLEDGLHPTTIVNGYTAAADRARERAAAVADSRRVDDEEALRDVVATAITGRWDAERTAFLSALTVRGYRSTLTGDRDGTTRSERLTIQRAPGGETTDSALIDGLVVDTGRSSTSQSDVPAALPDRLSDPRIAIVDDEIALEPDGSAARVSIETADQRRRLQEFESEAYDEIIETLRGLEVGVLFTQKSIDDRLRSRLAQAGIVSVERTRQDEIHKLSRATGAEPVMRVDDLTSAALGRADLVERRSLGGSTFVIVRAATSTQTSLLLRGSPEHVVEETERIVADGLRLLEGFGRRPALLPGGGGAEIALARDLREWSPTIHTREQLAAGRFADALETIPAALARNAGADALEIVLELRRRHDAGDRSVGFDATTGTVTDVLDEGIVDPLPLKARIISNATQAACAILRIDGIIRIAGSIGDAGPHDADGLEGHDHDHGSGGGHQPSTHGYPWAIGH
ncbi:Chaperonin GroEL (HSP60 family) [Halopenitus malekzadehii]|uniref:Chaperonin GroEL (HSP60 family) n=1 Tax=Halopenitus malekzadehii TaxID=1267564 RepID=A0A1H6IT06_9EURY|nr:thermosome subunit beta [Halopenitus malekzadehii]SEH49786.1 Chaperonin GroEL (HSP60 family) [Halopenitus malekzadehii]